MTTALGDTSSHFDTEFRNSPYRLLLASSRCQFFSKPGYTSWHLSSGFRDQRSSRVRGCRKPFNSMLQCTSSYMLLHGQVADTPTKEVDSPTSQLTKRSEVTDSEVSLLAENDYACEFYAAFKKICGPHEHQICSRNMVQNCLKPTTQSCSTGVRTRGNQMVEVEMGNRNTKNIKISVENAIYAEKYGHAQFAETCGNKQNMRKSHIRIKLTCLNDAQLAIEYRDFHSNSTSMTTSCPSLSVTGLNCQ